MAGKRNIALKMIMLTLSGVIAKTIDFSFRSYYASRLGQEGMGIFSLVMSAYGIILSLSSAGMGAAVSRLVAINRDKEKGTEEKILKTAVTMVLSYGLICTLLVFIFADKIALSYLHDTRCTVGLLCITPASIFMGVSYCIKGYFYGKGKVFIPASSEFVEQGIKLLAISFFLSKGLLMGAEYGSAGVLFGLTVGEGASCVYLCIWAYIKRGKTICEESKILPILRLSLPMTVSAVGGSFLRMTEDIWIVRGFRKFGMDIDSALGTYGLIHGMAMPLLVFPLTLISSFTAFLIPEIGRAEKNGNLCEMVKKVFKVALICGGMVFCIFFLFAEEISTMVYGSSSASVYIKPLSVLCPVMIIDSLSTSLLSGLGEQMKLLKYNILDSALRLSMVYFALPHFGNGAILTMIFLSNILTCTLTMRRVLKRAKLTFGIKKGIPKIRMPKIIYLKNNSE